MEGNTEVTKSELSQTKFDTSTINSVLQQLFQHIVSKIIKQLDNSQWKHLFSKWERFVISIAIHNITNLLSFDESWACERLQLTVCERFFFKIRQFVLSSEIIYAFNNSSTENP